MACYRHPDSERLHFVGKSVLCGEPGNDNGICGVYIRAKRSKRYRVGTMMTPASRPEDDPLTYDEKKVLNFECAQCEEHYPNYGIENFEKVGEAYKVTCLECSTVNYLKY